MAVTRLLMAVKTLVVGSVESKICCAVSATGKVLPFALWIWRVEAAPW